MTKILTLRNHKGGVGKTTSAITLAHYFALKGIPVLVIDLDTQGHVSLTLGKEKSDGLFKYFVGEIPVSELIVEMRPNLYVLQSGKKTENARYALTGRHNWQYAFADMLEPIQDQYKYIIFDSAPVTDTLSIAALITSDYYIVPTTMDYLAMEGAIEAVKTVTSLQVYKDVEPPALIGVLPTMFDRVTSETKTNLNTIRDVVGTNRILPPIPIDVKAREATNKGLTLWEYAPTCRAICGYEIEGDAYNSMKRVGGYLHLCEIVEGL